MFTPINDHVAAALKRIITQYNESTNLKNVIRAIVGPVQDIETALAQLNTLRALDVATGVQLDLIGTIVGLERPPGDTDDEYRQKLQGQIKINVSQGQPEQAIQTYELFTGADLIILFEGSSGDVLIESEYLPVDQAEVDLLLGILDKVLPAGVRPAGIVAFDASEAFAYDGALPGFGYGTVSDAGVGGKYPVLFTKNGYFEYAGNDSNGLGYGSVHDPLVGGWYASV